MSAISPRSLACSLALCLQVMGTASVSRADSAVFDVFFDHDHDASTGCGAPTTEGWLPGEPLGGTTYQVAVSGMAEGVVTATVPAGVARNASSVGNNASTSLDNQVKFDTTPPVITLNGGTIITIECGIDGYAEPGASATDNCDGTVPVTVGGETSPVASCSIAM